MEDPTRTPQVGVKPIFTPEQVAELRASMQQLGEVLTAQLRPMMEALSKAVQTPAMRQLLAAHREGMLPEQRDPCHCLCSVSHGDERDACTEFEDVIVNIRSQRLGLVEVPMCSACAERYPNRRRRGDVVSRIDWAIESWELGEDAMRWKPA